MTVSFSFAQSLRCLFAKVQTVLGHYKEAEEELLSIQSPKFRSDYTYMECLTRCRKFTSTFIKKTSYRPDLSRHEP